MHSSKFEFDDICLYASCAVLQLFCKLLCNCSYYWRLLLHLMKAGFRKRIIALLFPCACCTILSIYLSACCSDILHDMRKYTNHRTGEHSTPYRTHGGHRGRKRSLPATEYREQHPYAGGAIGHWHRSRAHIRRLGRILLSKTVYQFRRSRETRRLHGSLNWQKHFPLIRIAMRWSCWKNGWQLRGLRRKALTLASVTNWCWS